MSFRLLVALASLVLSHHALALSVNLNPATSLRFASLDEGRRALAQADEFSAALSPFDRSVRRRSADAITEAQFLDFASNQVLPWTAADASVLRDVLQQVGARFYAKRLRFPSLILMVKTSGQEEGNAPYTRGSAIVLPAGVLRESRDTLHEILVHELFHVLTDHNPALKDSLYEVIGFGHCGSLRLPPDLEARRITNPDSPSSQYCTSLGSSSSGEVVFPVLLSEVERYDPRQHRELFRYIGLDLLVAHWRDGAWHPTYANGELARLSGDQFSAFMARIGRNTSTSAHPEEILADNFVMLVNGARNLPSPWVVSAIDRVLGWSQDAGWRSTQAVFGR